MFLSFEDVVAQWCYPLTLQPEQSGRVGLKPAKAPPLECHDEGSQARLALSYFCDPSAWRQKTATLPSPSFFCSTIKKNSKETGSMGRWLC